MLVMYYTLVLEQGADACTYKANNGQTITITGQWPVHMELEYEKRFVDLMILFIKGIIALEYKTD